jgi:hypothetical protein
MIIVSTIVDLCRSELDAEDSDRYLFDTHFKPAINIAQKWLVLLYNRLFGTKKVSEESLYELHAMRVFQANLYSRISFPSNESELGKLWTITGVHPKITTIPVDPTIEAATAKSVWIDDVSVDQILKSAHRATIEEWGEMQRNPVLAGSPLITNDELIEYAYLNPIDYKGGYDPGSDEDGDVIDLTARREIAISPSVAGELVGISYLSLPDDIDEETDTIPFPEALTELVMQKVLQFISIKDDDSVNLYQITNKEVAKSIQLLS